MLGTKLTHAREQATFNVYMIKYKLPQGGELDMRDDNTIQLTWLDEIITMKIP